MWMILRPMIRSAGSACSKAVRSPPTNIEMLPVAARWQPPDTGASSARAPVRMTRSPSRLTSRSSVVLISTHSLPAERPSRTPSRCSRTCALMTGDGRHVMMRSDLSASSFGVAAHCAPPASSGFATVSSRSCTISSPPLRSRVAASFEPRFPKPMKPMIMAHASSIAAQDGGIECPAGEDPPHERLEMLEWSRRIVRIERCLIPSLAEADTTLVPGMVAVGRPQLGVFTEKPGVVQLLEHPVVLDHPGDLGPDIGADDLGRIVGVVFGREGVTQVMDERARDHLFIGAVRFRP